MKKPNTRLQTPDKHQAPNTNVGSVRSPAIGLVLGFWILSGAWNLELGFFTGRAAEAAKPLYQNDFSNTVIGNLPDEMLVLDGAFAVQETNGNKVLRLPGAPLETFGVLFGPSESANVMISARIFSTKRGRREPAFAVGLNGNAGFKLQVSAAKDLVELYKGDEVVAKEPFDWESGTWTMFKLQVRKVKEGEFAVTGKVWKQGAPEPENWLIQHTEKTEEGKDLLAGKASIWGNPFSGMPIDYDDLVVTALR